MTAPAVDVPAPPPLSHLPGVELMHTGTWDASSGRHTFTTDDLANAVAALECPAVRRPILKLGHTDPRFDGEPAAGWLANMATANDGHSLVADFVGMPGWLGPILASAFPDRSIEGQWDYRCAIGHNHGFVLTGLALLGVAHPAIGTLASLQDVGRMYGVELSEASGPAFTIDLKGPPAMSKTTTVAATVSTEDVRRAYYDDAPWELWIEEISLEPLQLIVVNDETGERLRVPVIVDPDGNGADGVEFGTPVAVVVRYEDVTPAAPAAAADGEAVAASASQTVRYASRTESRPDRPVAASTPAAAADGPSEGASVVEITNEDLAALRTALGLDDTADLAAIIAAVTDTMTTFNEMIAALRTALGLEETADFAAIIAAVEALVAAAPEGTEVAAAAGSVVSIDREAFASLQRDAKLGRAAHERQESEAREKVVDDAIQLGKIPPSRRAHWLTLMSADPKGTADTLAGIPNETAFPIAERGHSVTPEVSAAAGGDTGWFNTAPTKEA
ncbi:phage protease [Gordonia malaquae]|uniref:phage protease n=1 Tax=Gordonia malaquae TaxID=410332 RepID=UPI0030C79A81